MEKEVYWPLVVSVGSVSAKCGYGQYFAMNMYIILRT